MKSAIITTASNCDACGDEYILSELRAVKLAQFDRVMYLCDHCIDKTSEEQYKSALDLVKEVSAIASDGSSNVEERLQIIRNLLK